MAADRSSQEGVVDQEPGVANGHHSMPAAKSIDASSFDVVKVADAPSKHKILLENIAPDRQVWQAPGASKPYACTVQHMQCSKCYTVNCVTVLLMCGLDAAHSCWHHECV